MSLTVKSMQLYLRLRIRYGINVEMNAANSIKRKCIVELLLKNSLCVESVLMYSGPYYIKFTEERQCKIGKKIFVSCNCSITCVKNYDCDYCNIANNIVIVDQDHRIGEYGVEEGRDSTPVHIGTNVWIGANAAIL